MKIMKNILFTITLLVSASAFAMEAPPTAPVKVADARLLLPLKGLPADIQRKLFPLCMEGDLYDSAETILAFAGTNKENQAYINENLFAILYSFPNMAKPIEIYKLLENKTVSLPAMQKPPMKRWLKDGQDRRKELLNIFNSGQRNLNRVLELLAIKNVDLNHACNLDLNHAYFRDGISLDFGAAIPCQEETFRKVTFLQMAVRFGWAHEVRLLLDAGANPNLTPDRSDTPLAAAIVAEIFHANPPDNPTACVEIVKMLLKAGANPEDYGNARANGRHDIVTLLDAASLARKQKLEERKRRLYRSKIESNKSNSALGCTIA